MKPYLTSAVLLLLLCALPSAVRGQTCSCNASDSSCAVSVTCRHGGTAVCSPSNGCYATCGNVEAELLDVRVSLKVNNGDSSQVASEISRQTGKPVEFSPKNANELFNFELSDAPLWNALKFLSKYGKIVIGGMEFEKLETIRQMFSDKKTVSINFSGVTVKNVVAKLSFWSGVPLRVKSGNAEAPLTISLKDVTFEQIIDRVSSEANVTISKVNDSSR